MTLEEREFKVRLGRGGSADGRSFVGQVERAARKSAQGARGCAETRQSSGSRFGRGRSAMIARSLRSPSRRVMVKARVVRHAGAKFRAVPLSRHIAYLAREGVTRDGADANLFDRRSDQADESAFADRCEDDRHHFRFIVSPEDAAQMADLRAFTRELMADVEKDLDVPLDWVAVDHWNTDNPHVHVLLRGRQADGQDLVISPDYIRAGMRARAEARVSLELGPRSQHEVAAALSREADAERWTGLDAGLRAAAEETGGVVDLRPGASQHDQELRRLLVGRAAKLERLGLAETVGSGRWVLKAGFEPALRELGARGDIIKTLHQAMSRGQKAPDIGAFALHDEAAEEAVIGRFVARGLQDELKGSAYAIVEGVDGRTHYLRYADLQATGDARADAIVEARSFEGADGRRKTALLVRSDFSIEAQIAAPGATWLDRQLLAGGNGSGNVGFGAEVREAIVRRAGHLVEEGLATRQGGRTVFGRDLLDRLRRRDLDAAASRLSAELGKPHQPSATGERVAGVYRRRVDLSSGRFAMIDDVASLQLVPWQPALEQHIGREMTGMTLPSGRIDWNSRRSNHITL